MAEVSGLDEAAAEKRLDGPSSESMPPGTSISRVKLLDTMVDTFLEKLVAAGSYQRFADCYKHFHQLQPEMTQRIHDKFVTQLQASIREEISEIKEEGNLETVLNSLDRIVEDGKDHKGPAWSHQLPPPCSRQLSAQSAGAQTARGGAPAGPPRRTCAASWHPTSYSSGTPSCATCKGRRPRTRRWPRPSWQGAGRWRCCSGRCRASSRPGRPCTESGRSWQLC
ncbi:polyamine-modulated factor 1 isoform X1 [Heterocephalus glaber]|uniref:Polyamine-modulated factor 1 isoform X1 n=1 Tax=Heterocephalus glaber TaxID=10181 RepID=A0AAX6S7H3_HETGA|nr:polyamine-modulated factor 1 isoform X1 [Heterocephalus glaber]